MELILDHQNCFVHQLDESNCFVCLAQQQDRERCSFAKEFGFLDIFCTHPDRSEFPRKRLPENTIRQPSRDMTP
jgi:hypothetical protein